MEPNEYTKIIANQMFRAEVYCDTSLQTSFSSLSRLWPSGSLFVIEASITEFEFVGSEMIGSAKDKSMSSAEQKRLINNKNRLYC